MAYTVPASVATYSVAPPGPITTGVVRAPSIGVTQCGQAYTGLSAGPHVAGNSGPNARTPTPDVPSPGVVDISP